MKRIKHKTTKQRSDSLHALQDFHQLSLLVWSHASKHGGSQHKLQCHHEGKRRITQLYTCSKLTWTK